MGYPMIKYCLNANQTKEKWKKKEEKSLNKIIHVYKYLFFVESMAKCSGVSCYTFLVAECKTSVYLLYGKAK